MAVSFPSALKDGRHDGTPPSGLRPVGSLNVYNNYKNESRWKQTQPELGGGRRLGPWV